MWKKNEEKTTCFSLKLEDHNDRFSVDVRNDGCVHLRRYYSVDDEDSDYIHICDLDAMIEKLQAVKAAALEHFGEDWPY